MAMPRHSARLIFHLLVKQNKRYICTPLSCKEQGAEGFSLPLSIIIGFMLLLGGLALASRSNWSIFGSAFQNNTWSAKDAAEIGMNYFVNELNKPRNRWLTVVRQPTNGARDPDMDENYNGNDYNNNPNQSPPSTSLQPQGDLWINRNTSERVLELRRNPCWIAEGVSDSDSNPFYGSSTGGLDPNGATSYNYGKWYVNDNGSISSTQGSARRSFRLVKVYRQPFAGNVSRVNIDVNGDGTLNERDELMNVWRDRGSGIQTGVGKMVIQVEGQSYQNNKIVASVILEKEFELTPKCCGLPFGGRHGNVDYRKQTTGAYAGTSACNEALLGFGLLGGSAEANTGSITLRGRATNIEDDQGEPINPIFCLASNRTGCAVDVNAADINVAIVDYTLPDAFTYANPAGGAILPASRSMTPGIISACTNACDDFSDNTNNSTQKLLYRERIGSENVTVVNGGVSSSWLSSNHNFCTISQPVNPSQEEELHCNLSRIEVSGGSYGKFLFITGRRRIRLYFPSPGVVIDLQGNNYMGHCSALQPSSGSFCLETRQDGSNMEVTDLSLFGSNSPLTPQQQIQLTGTPGITNKYFLYFPTGRVSLVGNSTFEGVLWTDDIASTGNPTWIVPGSGMASVQALMGFANQGNTNEVSPIFYDFVLRATDRYRWIGG